MEDDAATAMRAALEARDATDPLGAFRDEFLLREGLIYLDGNSLGPLHRSVPSRLDACQRKEWGDDLIASWNTADWVSLPLSVGARIAPLIGAEEGTVAVADSTSVNLFKVLAAALAARPDRRVIVSERGNFPTDLYVAEGLSSLLDRGHTLRLIDRPEDLDQCLDADVAVVMLTHVNYRTGRMFDLADVTRRIHGAGAIALWDLAHSTGAVPVDLSAAGADFAVGCTYKYLNGGPGAPAFLYVSPSMQSDAIQPLSGWFGHDAPFAFDHTYRPAAGIRRFLTGTPPVMSLIALDEALKVWRRVRMTELRKKSLALTDLFIRRVEATCADHPLTLVTPRDPAERGSQVSFAHPDAYPVMQALIARGVVGDFRAPDVLRFGFAPLYTRYVDVFDAARHLHGVLQTGEWRDPQFSRRSAVT